ncbi:MAG TPA: hypothetical protein VMR52_12140 [Dehalococcoidia bacterium]|nr:hypothetical protein [Dehalococcoidia bacterium]
MIPDLTNDSAWATAFAAIDRAFTGAPRPEHFTGHSHCCECSETDIFFQAHTPETFAALTDPLETLPVAFLTEEAFAYLAPGILRYLPRTGEHYNAGDVLFHLEDRWLTFTSAQQTALRDLLYLTYERLASEIEATPFDQHTMTRILNGLDRVTQPDATS